MQMLVTLVKRLLLPTRVSLPIAAALMAFIRLAYLEAPAGLVLSCAVSGVLQALTPLSIIAGAILLFRVMEHTGCLPWTMWCASPARAQLARRAQSGATSRVQHADGIHVQSSRRTSAGLRRAVASVRCRQGACPSPHVRSSCCPLLPPSRSAIKDLSAGHPVAEVFLIGARLRHAAT